MAEMNITKTEFEAFKADITAGIKALNDKFDKLLDPKTGIFSEIQNIKVATKRAHERLDECNESQDRIKLHIYGENGRGGLLDKMEDAEKTLSGWKTNFKWAIGLIATPMLLGIGALIWTAISGGK